MSMAKRPGVETRPIKVIEEIVNGNEVDMSQAQTYKKVLPVLAFMVPIPVSMHHVWGIQEMTAGSILVIDPSTSEAYGVEPQTFAMTYAAVPGKPGFFTKTALIRAMKIPTAFVVTSMDNPDVPERGEPGDYLVETIRKDGKPDRYLIPADSFERMYRLATDNKSD